MNCTIVPGSSPGRQPATAERAAVAGAAGTRRRGTGIAAFPASAGHGPRFDPNGWGEAHAERSDCAGTSEDGSQGHSAGERSFDHGPDDTAAANAALREPGDRGTPGPDRPLE